MDWKQISERVLAGKQMAPDEALRCLQARDDDLLALLDAAFRVRRYYFKRGVHLHVIRNARSGSCSEDCAYCRQSARADGNAPQYPWQSREEIIAGAREAHRMGTFRYCVVSSGRAPADADISMIKSAGFHVAEIDYS